MTNAWMQLTSFLLVFVKVIEPATWQHPNSCSERHDNMQLCKARFRSGLFLTVAMVFVPQVVSDRSEFSRPGNLCLQLARQDWSCDDIVGFWMFSTIFYDFLWVLIWTGLEANRWLPASLTQRTGSNRRCLIAWFSSPGNTMILINFWFIFEHVCIHFASFCTDLDRRWCGSCCCPATRWLQLCLGCVTFAYSPCAWSPSQAGSCSCIEPEIVVATCNNETRYSIWICLQGEGVVSPPEFSLL